VNIKNNFKFDSNWKLYLKLGSDMAKKAENDESDLTR